MNCFFCLTLPLLVTLLGTTYAGGEEQKDTRTHTILCWVDATTEKGNIQVVLRTWGAFCDKILFMTNKPLAHRPSYETVSFDVSGLEGRAVEWEQTKQSFASVYEHFPDYNWYLMVKENNYVVMKNLREYLLNYDFNEELFFGRIWPEESSAYYPLFNSWAGYVMSNAAIVKIAMNQHLLLETKKNNDWSDLELTKSLSSFGLTVTNVWGSDGLQAMFPLAITTLRAWDRTTAADWYFRLNPSAKPLEECCSRYWISTTDVTSADMVMLHRKIMAGKEASGNHPSELLHPYDESEDAFMSRPIRSVNWNEPNDAGKILVWVLTMPSSQNVTAVTVADTWGKEVDKLLFVSSAPHPRLEVIVVNLSGPESREAIWEKVQQAWQYVYLNYVNDYDWFMKADDDTFVAVKNLRSFLAQYDNKEKHYFGRRFVSSHKAYMSGGSGYVVSKATLRALGEEKGWDVGPLVESGTGSEDMHFGYWMAALNIYATDVLGPDEIHAFIPLNIAHMRKDSRNDSRGSTPSWFWHMSPTAGDKENCCSRYWISSHYNSPSEMVSFHEEVILGIEANGQLPSERRAAFQNTQPRMFNIRSSELESAAKKLKILCNVHMIDSTHPQTVAIRRTWGALCDKLIFTTTQPPTIDNIPIDVPNPNSASIVWEMTKLSFLHIYQNHINDFDWFLKVDDHNYVMMQNLRRYLAVYDWNEARVFGRIWPEGSGNAASAAGYVMSREALRKLGIIDIAFPPTDHDQTQLSDDMINRAFDRLSIPSTNVLGPDGLEAFFPLSLSTLRHWSKETAVSWYYPNNPSAKELEECCSRYWISTSDVTSDEMFNFRRLELGGQEAAGKHPSELPAQSAVDIGVQDAELQRHAGKVLVWVMMTGHNSKANAVSSTWGSLVDRLVFFSTKPSNDVNVVTINITNPINREWEMTKFAWNYIYQHYGENFDWFMRVDDETYVVVNNLRSFLGYYDSKEALYFGRYATYPDKISGSIEYNHGGAGYVISQATLRNLMNNKWDSKNVRAKTSVFADVEFGRIMKAIGVRMTSTVDDQGLERFLPANIRALRSDSRAQDGLHWYWKLFPDAGEGSLCCSTRWITTHFVTVAQMNGLHTRISAGNESS